ncbi:Arginase/deacetylase [Sparassis crispa]|uniref:Arginase/deacetylase n=1 Tax=Sparassis crispa TaxID=139825 RepID=A0A401GRH0_9APHY|nr:Arginase/deacetylase [Sparassis crispa]GBE84828.1 Arginase/deacetylase [Sparassis crispa]
MSLPSEDKFARLNVSRTGIFLQKACLQHRYIRSKDNSNIVERPERLRAVHIGLAAAIAHLEDAIASSGDPLSKPGATHAANTTPDPDELASALGKLKLSSASSLAAQDQAYRIPVSFVHSSASVDILDNPAVKFIHGDIERDVYLEDLKTWAQDSHDKIAKGESELPDHLPQGDLYLCPASVDAIQGALGTVCEAVDAIISSASPPSARNPEPMDFTRAFVAIRPPGHHCGEDTPLGFCFVNNVAVAAAHAHLKHGINRVVILDIDLHHGNGTQSIAWQINEESYRKTLEESYVSPSGESSLQIYYGSIHDILSYPCEDGKVDLVQAASVSIHGSHGQHIENIHLKPYSSERQFWGELYAGPYAKLLGRAGNFLDGTGGPGNDVLVFISCGFDASEHEHASMSRHHRRVPTTFYQRFARDAGKFAERYAHGRLVSVLEGGYSDRALTSGAMAHLTGLLNLDDSEINQNWWSLDSLVQLESATKKRRAGRASLSKATEPWLERALEIFASIDSSHLLTPSSSRVPIPLSSRTLRERKKGSSSADPTPASSPPRKMGPRKSGGADKKDAVPFILPASVSEPADLKKYATAPVKSDRISEEKKLPRVILRLGPRSDAPLNT